ncbi:MAG: MoaD/ThiS family protein, partial [Chloroflexota bacterium]
FAGYYRTLAGQSSLDLDLAEGATVEDALAVLDERLEGRCHQVFYPDGTRHTHLDLLILVNTEIARRDAVLHEGNVMAIVPPMAGG